MTSEIKPEDVRLPEPAMHDNGDVFGNDLTYGFTADQVRAAVLAERERCAALCDAIYREEQLEPECYGFAEECAAAIRSGK